MSQQVVFADRIMNIALQNGLVRLELGVVEPARNGEPQKVSATHRLVMPLEGFVNSFQLQESVIKELVARQAKARAQQPAESTQAA